MSVAPEAADHRHDLNNVLCKILAAAELALDQACGDEVRRELESIITLAEEGGAMIAAAPHLGRLK